MFGIYGEYERMRSTKKIAKAAVFGILGFGVPLMLFMNPLAALSIGCVITLIEIYLPNNKKVATKWITTYANTSPGVIIKEIIPENASDEVSGETNDVVFDRVTALMQTRSDRMDTFHIVTTVTPEGGIRKIDMFRSKNQKSSLSFGAVQKLLGG